MSAEVRMFDDILVQHVRGRSMRDDTSLIQDDGLAAQRQYEFRVVLDDHDRRVAR